MSIASQARAQDRGGFTLLMTLGYGIQAGDFTGQASTNIDQVQGIVTGARNGLAGLNLGIGGFVSKNTALMLRLSGTTAKGEYYVRYHQAPKTTDITSGAMALDMQRWLGDRWNVEIGAGVGFLQSTLDNHRGVGLFAAIGYSVLCRGGHSLQIGIEDAHYHDSDREIDNIGLCVGFQFL
jgi:hypothetical protein